MATDLFNTLMRVKVVSGLTTKGSNLTGIETDNNFDLYFQFLSELLASANIPSYNGGTEYVQGDIVKYSSRLWQMVNASPQTGVEPGTDGTVWEITSIGQFIGNQAIQRFATSLVIKKDGNTNLTKGEEGDGLLKINSEGAVVMIQHDGSDFNDDKQFFEFSV